MPHLDLLIALPTTSRDTHRTTTHCQTTCSRALSPPPVQLAERYTFYLRADDEVQLWLDGALAFDTRGRAAVAELVYITPRVLSPSKLNLVEVYYREFQVCFYVPRNRGQDGAFPKDLLKPWQAYFHFSIFSPLRSPGSGSGLPRVVVAIYPQAGCSTRGLLQDRRTRGWRSALRPFPRGIRPCVRSHLRCASSCDSRRCRHSRERWCVSCPPVAANALLRFC